MATRTSNITQSSDKGTKTFLVQFYENDEYVGCKWVYKSIFTANDLKRDWESGKLTTEEIKDGTS